jgi:hypothetical protein
MAYFRVCRKRPGTLIESGFPPVLLVLRSSDAGKISSLPHKNAGFRVTHFRACADAATLLPGKPLQNGRLRAKEGHSHGAIGASNRPKVPETLI